MNRLPLLATLALAAALHAPAKTGIVINEDSSHFFMTRSADDMTIGGLHAFVDQYAGTQVSHLFLNPNAMKASFKSATRDAIWELGDQEPPDEAAQRWLDNARLLHERGLEKAASFQHAPDPAAVDRRDLPPLACVTRHQPRNGEFGQRHPHRCSAETEPARQVG